MEAHSHPYKLGKTYLIRTVTMAQAGILVEVHPGELVLEKAVWVAETGRFWDSLKDPKNFSVTEPFASDVIVSRASIVDATVIPEFLPAQK